MSQQDINLLKDAIAKLNERYEELKEYSLDLSSSKTLELLDQLELLNVKIVRMESVLNHLEAAAVTVNPPSQEDQQELDEAIEDLSERVKKDMQWAAVIKLTKSFLSAARALSDSVTVRTSG